MLTLHHLNFSRSTRVLWLLEELGLDYRLVRYDRDARFRAPPSLKSVHPLGKAPILQDDALTLVESAAILRHIDTRHGAGRFSPPAGSDAASLHDEWLQYAESSAAFPIIMTLIGGMMGGLPPGLAAFTAPELEATLDHIAAAVAAPPWLTGPAFTIADIQIAYLLVLVDNAGLIGDRPALHAYLDRLKARPAFARAIDAGGPMVPPAR